MAHALITPKNQLPEAQKLRCAAQYVRIAAPGEAWNAFSERPPQSKPLPQPIAIGYVCGQHLLQLSQEADRFGRVEALTL